MKLLLALFASLVLCTGLSAEEVWSKWQTLEGELIGKREGAVQIRSRYSPSADEDEKGYVIQYELRNGSSTHVAKVSMAFWRQNPRSLYWEEPDQDDPSPKVHQLAPGGPSVSGTTRVPRLNVQRAYGAIIQWQEDFTPEDTKDENRKADDKDGAEKDGQETPPAGETAKKDKVIGIVVNGGDGGYTSSAVPNVEFHVPLDSKTIFNTLSADENFPVSENGIFSGTITITRPPKWLGVDWSAVNEGLQSKWMNYTIEELEWDQEHHNTASLTIISKSNTEVRYSFTGSNGTHLCAMLHHQMQWDTKPESITLTALQEEEIPEGNGPIDTTAGDKVIPGSKSTTTKSTSQVVSGSPKASAVKHEGYWYDPTDKSRNETDPTQLFIYVRVGGVAKRVTLAVARKEYGVPANATPATMTHYNELLHMITKNKELGTNLRQ